MIIKIDYKYIAIGFGGFLIFLIAFGIPTAIIPNPIYGRMIAATFIDKVLLVIISILLGAYIGLYFYGKKLKQRDSKDDAIAGISVAPSFFALSCPICISFLVAVFGTTALLTYFEPFRPVLGLMSIALLSAALYIKIISLKKGCRNCA